MKIAVNAVRVSRQGGGGTDHYIIHLVNYLAREGYRFDLFTLVPEHFPDVPSERIKVPFPFNFQPKRASANLKNAASGDRPKKAVKNRAAILYGDFIKMFWTQFVFPFYLIFGRYDIVFSPSQIDALPFSPVKQVIAVLDVIPFLFKLPAVKHSFFLKRFFPIALRRSARVAAISENTKKDIMKLFGVAESKIAVTLLAQPEFDGPKNISKAEMDQVKLKYNLRNYVLCVSGNHANKNLPRLILAFQEIASKTDCTLAIAGYQDANQQKPLEEIVQETGLSDRVAFLGHTPAGDLPLLYSAAEIFVFPSLYEGFGLPPLEALAYGVPAAVSNRSSLPEVVGEAGVYFDPEDVENMADVILGLLNDPELRGRLRQAGPARAKEFSWQKTARATWEAFECAFRN